MATNTGAEVASMAGITVRSSHHYDKVGLLTPSGRTDGGYRMYDEEGIDRPPTTLTYRELGLGLDEIASVIEDENEASRALRNARDRVLDRIRAEADGIHRMLDALMDTDAPAEPDDTARW
jgi:DNA-binding transcriptional MerR regulator